MNDSFISGGIPRPEDKRDYALGTVSTPSIVYEDTTMLPIHFQGKQPACGAHAFAWYAQYLHWKKTGEIKKFTPRYNWIKLKQQDGFPVDSGTDMRSIFKFEYQKDGALDFEPMENNVTYDFKDYASPSFLTNQTPTLFGGNYAFEDKPTFERIQELLNEHGAIIALIALGDGFWLPSWADKATNPITLGNFVGHHFVVLHRPKEGQDPNLIHFANSFGTEWGNGGHGVFDRSYMPNVLEVGAIVENPVIPSPVTPAPQEDPQVITNLQTQVSLLSKVVSLLRQLLGIK